MTNPLPPPGNRPPGQWAPPLAEELVAASDTSSPSSYRAVTRNLFWGPADHPKKPWKRKRVLGTALIGLVCIVSVLAEPEEPSTSMVAIDAALSSDGTSPLDSDGLGSESTGDIQVLGVAAQSEVETAVPETSATTVSATSTTSVASTTIVATTQQPATTKRPTTTTAPTTSEPTTTVRPTTAATAKPSTTVKPTTTVAPPKTTQAPHYANCTDVRNAGAAPIRRGDPGFQDKFDRDKDGIGCE